MRGLSNCLFPRDQVPLVHACSWASFLQQTYMDFVDVINGYIEASKTEKNSLLQCLVTVRRIKLYSSPIPCAAADRIAGRRPCERVNASHADSLV